MKGEWSSVNRFARGKGALTPRVAVSRSCLTTNTSPGTKSSFSMISQGWHNDRRRSERDRMLRLRGRSAWR